MKKLSLLLISSVMVVQSIHAQDSLRIQSSLKFETKGTGILAAGADNFDCITCHFFERVRDNPFHHFAIYSGITHVLEFDQSYKIETGIFLEERSFSGGSNTLNNWVVFPKILLSGSRSIDIYGQEITYKLSGGDYWNTDFDDMLRIHNLDYQGLNVELISGDYSLGFLLIGDLSLNIGLGLHQYHKFYLRRESGRWRTTLSFSDNHLTDYYNHVSHQDFNIGINNRIQLNDHFQLETQLESRLNPELGPSLAVGLGLQGTFKNLRLASRFKYYQTEFNQGYFSNVIRYRGDASYVGDQLYPLKNYYRNYSQWANYTRLQGRNLMGFELELNWKQNIWRRLDVFSNLDLSIVGDPETRTGRTTPLYEVGVSTSYTKFLSSRFYFTNKHMDLDNFYQTFQASEMPFFAGSVILNLDKIRLGSFFTRS